MSIATPLGKQTRTPFWHLFQTWTRCILANFAIALHIAQFVEKPLITQDGLSEESLSNHVDLPENLEVVEIPINFYSRILEKKRYLDAHSGAKFLRQILKKS